VDVGARIDGSKSRLEKPRALPTNLCLAGLFLVLAAATLLFAIMVVLSGYISIYEVKLRTVTFFLVYLRYVNSQSPWLTEEESV
jgi:hypothetical protein